MAYREVSRVEIAEVVRRWQSGMSQRQIATGTGLSRATVRRYIDAAVEAGLARDGPAPSEEQLTRLAGVSVAGPRKVEIPTEEVLAPWADQVYEWLTADRLQVTRIHELLAGRGCRVSYTSLRRFIVRRGWQRRSPATVRMGESAPGEVAEMDFGRLGLIEDPETGRRRAVWALIVVLTYSRHSFVWPTFSQKLVDVIEGLEAAWAFFEGVPKYLVIDNFPAAVAGVDPLHPRLTRGFLEYSQHRGFISDPARVRHPRDKPRVERGVPYVRERFFKGGEFTGLSDMRSAARRWCLEVAGQRIHGTTRRQPLTVFLDEPTIGLDAVSKLAFRDFIKRFNRESGVTVILTTHDMDDIEALCTRVMVIGEGRILSDGTLEALRERIAPERRLIVHLEERDAVVSDPEATVTQQEGHRVHLSFDPRRTPPADLIARIASRHAVRDLFVESLPIEEIVARMYAEERR